MTDRKIKEYVDHLKECISHREEQIVAMREQLKAKDDIDEMRQHISTSDDKIAELLAKVEKLTAVVEKAAKAETIEIKEITKGAKQTPCRRQVEEYVCRGVWTAVLYSHYRISKFEMRPVLIQSRGTLEDCIKWNAEENNELREDWNFNRSRFEGTGGESIED